MNRLFHALKFRRPSQSYERLGDGRSIASNEGAVRESDKKRFSWIEYFIFLLLGVAMLWSWNMFLAATPYFQSRFSSSDWILNHFQSAITSITMITNITCIFLLTKLQRNASYPKRIVASLIINIIVSAILTFSTILFRDLSATNYFAFLILTVFLTSAATALSQNGAITFASGFGSSEYTQAIMTGQGVAGVLPCIAQIVSVLSVPEGVAGADAAQESPRSAFAFFLTATAVSTITLAAFLYLARLHPERSAVARAIQVIDEPDDQEPCPTERPPVAMFHLFQKLRSPSLAIIACFALTLATMPIFTAKILSVHSHQPTSPTPQQQQQQQSTRLFQPACFIPLAFLFWNAGDLLGRSTALVPAINLVRHRTAILTIALGRIVFVPLYFLCNLHGEGAVVPSDLFYLVVVQLLFGLSNGYVASTCMMAAAEWVAEGEREAAGGFMVLMMVLGLTVGSFLSFLTAWV